VKEHLNPVKKEERDAKDRFSMGEALPCVCRCMDRYPIKLAPTKSLTAGAWQRRTKHLPTMVSVILSHGAATGCDGQKDVSPPPLALAV